jgi:hypothetical protein
MADFDSGRTAFPHVKLTRSPEGVANAGVMEP